MGRTLTPLPQVFVDGMEAMSSSVTLQNQELKPEVEDPGLAGAA